MREIQDLKNKFCRIYANECDKVEGEDVFQCSLQGQCICKYAAEVQAYLYKILPSGYQNFTIFDFDGYDKDGTCLIDSEKVIQVKEQISQYCWGLKYSDVKNLGAKDPLALDKRSMMDRRHLGGHCIVIHGDSDRKVGRTLIASIILREAIRRRFSSNLNVLQIYEWIEFAHLKLYAKNDQLIDYQCADWLVVDNLGSVDQDAPRYIKEYITSIIDPFFISRFDKQLPTILVFKFNIHKEPIQGLLGVGIDRIINNKSTMEIALS
tara:strand:+ start:39 stop:833 length:795 start_codon:yes stop_codon:yes gene_type:complete